MKFSVLMSIYYKENPIFFDRAMKSIWDEQTTKPNEIVLVEDGKLTKELYLVIDNWKRKLGRKLVTIPLENNVGLGDALNIGLNTCSYDLIARMDTDDISLPIRFEKQLEIFENSTIDICSSWISEFENDENKIISYRKLPELHNDIVVYAKKRSPINHPAVMYRKDAVLKAGGYKKMMWFEDYYLWVRMIQSGSKFYNIQEPLVKMRTKGQIKRRKGIHYIKNEIELQKEFLKLGFITNREFVVNVIIRNIPRILPEFFLRKIYQVFLRK